MSSKSLSRRTGLAIGIVLVMLAGGCNSLRTTARSQPAFYSLDQAAAAVAVKAPPPSAPATAPTLIVDPPHAVSGFDSRRIIYVREAHKLEYFAHSEWVDTPSRMLAPLIVNTIERTGSFRAVLLTPSPAAGDLRLDTEILRLQQDFTAAPSRLRLSLRAHLVDNVTRRVIASRQFDETVDAASADPYGGVIAANRAVQVVLEQLAAFCAEAAASWRPPPKGSEAPSAGR